MQVFINESSIHGQFTDQHKSQMAFNSIIESLSLLAKLKNLSVFKDKNVFYRTVTNQTNFSSFLKANRNINNLFVNSLNTLNAQIWQNSESHNDQISYIFNEKDYVGTSVAEISSRKNIDKNLNCFLLNFQDSEFQDHSNITVMIEEKSAVIIDCIENKDILYKWLLDRHIIKPNEEYDQKSKIAPTFDQTILKDSSVFEKTNYINKGSHVYRKIGTSQLYAIDRFHKGKKAHIEVFDEKTRKHLGVSSYSKIEIDTSKKVKRRRIKLE